MAVFPLYATRIEKGTITKKTNIIESESGVQQRIALSATKRSFVLDIEGVPTRGVLDAAKTTCWKKHQQSGQNIIVCPYFNLENFIDFFDNTARGSQNSFTLKAWGSVVPVDMTVIFKNDDIQITYLSNNYCNLTGILLETVVC